MCSDVRIPPPLEGSAQGPLSGRRKSHLAARAPLLPVQSPSATLLSFVRLSPPLPIDRGGAFFLARIGFRSFLASAA